MPPPELPEASAFLLLLLLLLLLDSSLPIFPERDAANPLKRREEERVDSSKTKGKGGGFGEIRVPLLSCQPPSFSTKPEKNRGGGVERRRPLKSWWHGGKSKERKKAGKLFFHSFSFPHSEKRGRGGESGGNEANLAYFRLPPIPFCP